MARGCHTGRDRRLRIGVSKAEASDLGGLVVIGRVADIMTCM